MPPELQSCPSPTVSLLQLLTQEQILRTLVTPYGLVVELDAETGAIKRSLHDPTGHVVPSVSEVEDDFGTLYLGSYYAPGINKVELPKRL